MNKKSILITGIFTVVTLFSLTTTVKADLQSRPGVASLVNQSAESFFIKARNMEGPNQVMGMDAQIDQANGNKTGGTYNKIDVHMAKNTEWGTVAILSTSAYGECKSGKWGVADTTTGNKTGVYQMGTGWISNTPGNVGNYEYVSTIYDGVSSGQNGIGNGKIAVAKARYRNNYTAGITQIAGDATIEMQNWKSAGHKQVSTKNWPVYIRSADAMFGFTSLWHTSWRFSDSENGAEGIGIAIFRGSERTDATRAGVAWGRATSRVVAVCGEF